ncbi:hypothetical protein [Saccharopolyspora sp. NPDC002376]
MTSFGSLLAPAAVRLRDSAQRPAPRVAHGAAEWNSVLAMVASGLGICLLPRLATSSPDH